MRDDKIQTGLRIPQGRYEELRKMADRSGVSLNAIILLLVDIGLSAVTLGAEEAARSAPQIQRYSDGQCTP